MNDYSVYKDALVIGIDSSRQSPFRVLNRYYCPITTAIVYFNGMRSKMEYDRDSPSEFFDISDKPPEEALRESHKRMYELEVRAIHRASSLIDSLTKRVGSKKVIVMIDGPIVDPPSDPLYKNYINERANAILACKSAGALVIGCIKRIEGSHFINFLKANPNFSDLSTVAEGFGSDPQLIPLVFSSLKNLRSPLETIPIELHEPKSLLSKYQTAGMGKIYRIYLTQGGSRGLLGLEYFVLDDEDPFVVGEEICKAVRAWSFPRLNAPLPVIAAHRRCNIKRGSAEFLYRELLTRALSWEGGGDILDNLLRG